MSVVMMMILILILIQYTTTTTTTTATFSWLLQYVYYDSSVATFLGLGETRDKPIIPDDIKTMNDVRKKIVDTNLIENIKDKK